MWWKKSNFLPLLIVLSGCPVQAALGADHCPAWEKPLRYVDVFDGRPEELATLVPDKGNKSSGYWTLGYVYDAGRTVTVRCKYADGHVFDLALPNKISRCDYKLNEKKALTISCK